MTLLITIFAAIIATVLWYFKFSDSSMKVGTLALMYWGAALMWFVDAIFEYAELQAEYFLPVAADMINDAFLGLCVVALGLIIWLVMIIAKDPKGVLRKQLAK